jgi:hypothetical protein
MVLTVFLLAACGNQDDTTPGSGSPADGTVSGQVLAGPFCPVESAPADGSATGKNDECADKPTPARIRVTAISTGSVVATVRSDADGRFQVDLPVGQYELQALALDQHVEQGPPLLVRVSSDRVTDAVVRIDTGIR